VNLDQIITGLSTGQRATGWPLDWQESLCAAAQATRGDWSLSKRDVAVSTLQDSIPGIDLVKWVRAYARHGSPIDPVRIRCKVDGHDRHSYHVLVAPEEAPDGQERALEFIMQIVENPAMREGIITTLTRALQPLAQSLIRPVVDESIRELLCDDLQEEAVPIKS